jgi:ROS/MUCR transcriptional regulator protein
LVLLVRPAGSARDLDREFYAQAVLCTIVCRVCLRMHDELGPIYDDDRFAPLFPPRGRPAEAPWRLALVTVLRFAEGLRDRRAAERLRHPEVAHLPPPLRGALIAGGYTTRAAIDAADDEALLALPGLTPSVPWQLRRGRYDAPRDRAARQRDDHRYREYATRQRSEPQARADLPPLGVLLADDDGARVQCHICGAWHASLARHVQKGHGLIPDDYRERFGLARGLGLWSPAYAAKQRAAALARGQGQLGAAVLAEVGVPGRAPGIPARLSTRVAMSEGMRRRGAP